MTRLSIRWAVAVAAMLVWAGVASAQAPSITPTSLPDGEVTAAYSQSLDANDILPTCCTWSSSGTLPPGLSLSGTTGTATISGTPTTAGSFTFEITATDSVTGASTPQSYTVNIVAAPSISPGSLPTQDAGAYSQGLTASGGSGSYVWSVSAGSLPTGTTLSSTTGASVAISGSAGAGTYTFTITVTDGAGGSGNQGYTVLINPLPSVSPTPPPSGEVTVPYSTTLTVVGGTGPTFTWSLASGTLPGGLSLSSAGVLSGTPTQVSPPAFQVRVTDSVGVVSAPQSITVNIVAAPTITTASLAAGDAGSPYSQTLIAGNGTPPYTWSIPAASLPTGITLNSSTGVISGTTSSSNSFPLSVTVTDSVTGTNSTSLTLTINPPLIIATPPTLPSGTVGAAYTQTLGASGGASSSYTWSITSGALPGGLSLSGATISGTPSSSGTFNFTAQVTDAISISTSKAFTITIAGGLTITNPPTLPTGEVGVSYSQTLTAAGGTTPYTWSILSGSPPGGLTLAGNTITGIPTASGTFSFTVKVTDNNLVQATLAMTLTIAPALTITTSPTLPPGTLGASYIQALAAAGGAVPYHWSITLGALPKGLTLDAAAGSISGAPTSSGAFTFTVQVTDSASAIATKQFTLNTSASLAITTPPALPSGSAGVSYSVTLAAAGGTSPYLWLVTSGSLPAGLTLGSATGLISGTPTGPGTFTFGVSVTDSTSLRTTQEFNLTIGSGLVITTPPQLPAGATGSNYSQTLSAAGGTAPYSWVVTKGTLPNGLTLSNKGTIAGKPTANGASSFTIQVTDKNGATASEQFSLTIGAGLTITSGSTLPPGSLGQPYSPLTLAASGGTQPYTWSITGGALAGGMSLSASGTIAGTPTATGTFNFTVQVADASGAKASQAFTLSITPQALPQVNVAGLPETAGATQQIPFSITLASGYSLDIIGSITISFEPDAAAPADDPAIQFSTNGRTANFRIPANTTNALFAQNATQIILQTGTVSGAIKLTFALQAGGADLDASGLDRTITIARSVPSITNVSVVKSANGFEIHVTGYSTPRELTEADLTFAAAAGANLQTTSVTEGLTAVAQQWYQSATSVQYGSQFILVLPFTASQGSISAVGSVTVRLKNSQGISPGASANF